MQRRFPKGLKVHVHSLDRFGCLAALARVLHQVRYGWERLLNFGLGGALSCTWLARWLAGWLAGGGRAALTHARTLAPTTLGKLRLSFEVPQPCSTACFPCAPPTQADVPVGVASATHLHLPFTAPRWPPPP